MPKQITEVPCRLHYGGMQFDGADCSRRAVIQHVSSKAEAYRGRGGWTGAAWALARQILDVKRNSLPFLREPYPTEMWSLPRSRALLD